MYEYNFEKLEVWKFSEKDYIDIRNYIENLSGQLNALKKYKEKFLP